MYRLIKAGRSATRLDALEPKSALWFIGGCLLVACHSGRIGETTPAPAANNDPASASLDAQPAEPDSEMEDGLASEGASVEDDPSEVEVSTTGTDASPANEASASPENAASAAPENATPAAPTCSVEECPRQHLPTDPAERRRWIRRWSARFRNPRVPPGYDGDPRWVRFEAGRVLDALGAVEDGMTRAQVLRLLGRPDDNEVREDYWHYALSPVAGFSVEFVDGRATNAGYSGDTPPPFDL